MWDYESHDTGRWLRLVAGLFVPLYARWRESGIGSTRLSTRTKSHFFTVCSLSITVMFYPSPYTTQLFQCSDDRRQSKIVISMEFSTLGRKAHLAWSGQTFHPRQKSLVMNDVSYQTGSRTDLKIDYFDHKLHHRQQHVDIKVTLCVVCRTTQNIHFLHTFLLFIFNIHILYTFFSCVRTLWK